MATKIGVRRLGAPPKAISKRTPPRCVTTRSLTPKQRLFVEQYLSSLCAAEAYRAAYPRCTWSSANSNGSHLLRDNRIAQEVKTRLAAVIERYRPRQENVLGELAALAFSNVQDFYNRDGKLVPLDQLPVYAAAAVKKVQSREITTPAGEDGKRTTVAQVHELELHNKIAALRLVGAHVGLFAEQLELTLGKDFGELLREARARIAPAPAIEGEKVAK